MPWAQEDVWFDYHHQSLVRLAINDTLKIILGISGTLVALCGIYYLLPYIRNSWFYSRSAVGGRFTLDVYLLQILLVEKLFGSTHAWCHHWYMLLCMGGGILQREWEASFEGNSWLI